MAETIERWRVQAYEANVQHLSQQNRSFLETWVRRRTGIIGKVTYFERLSPADMRKTTTRHGDTVFVNIEHTRRAAFKVDFDWAQAVDEEDKLENITDPAHEYAVAAAAAVGRRIDQSIIDAVSGTAVTGETGSGTEVLPTAQKETTASGNTLAKMVTSLRILWNASVMVNPQDVVYIASPSSLEDVLNETDNTFRSKDFNPGMALLTATITSYLGMSWVISTLLPIVSGTTVRGTYLMHRNAVGLGQWVRVLASIDKRPDKNNLMQVLVKTMLGAVRVEDELVVENQITE